MVSASPNEQHFDKTWKLAAYLKTIDDYAIRPALQRIVAGCEKNRAGKGLLPDGSKRKRCQCAVCGQFLSCLDGPHCDCIRLLDMDYNIHVGAWPTLGCYECYQSYLDYIHM